MMTVTYEPPRLVGLSGYARAGKDTVAALIGDLYGHKRYAFADALRAAALALDPWVPHQPAYGPETFVRLSSIVNSLGWDQAKKNPEVRRVLQKTGDEVGRTQFGEDVWIEKVFDQINDNWPDRAVISDVRYPNEADVIKQNGGVVVRIDRPGVTAVNGHRSDSALDGYDFDFTIHNDGDLDALLLAIAEGFVKHA